MSNRLTAAVGAAVLTASSIGAAVPGPALAGDESLSRWVLRDGPGDVLAGAYPYKNAVRVNRPSVDITRAVARHGPRAVTVRMRFADLRRVRRPHVHWYKTLFFIPRDGRPPFLPSLIVEATPKHQGGRAIEFEDIHNDALIQCPRLRHNIDYATDVVTIRVPRRCLGAPAWVRAHIENELLGGAVDARDSAHDRDYKYFDGWPPPRTPRLSHPDR